MTSRLRPFVQAAFLILFVVFFADIFRSLSGSWIRNFFFNADPLILFALAISGGAISGALLLSAATVVITVIFGRVFCGWACPMGTLLEWSERLVPSRAPHPPYGKGLFRNVKYYLLAFLVFGALFGFTAVLFFDPIVSLTRAFALTIAPAVTITGNGALELFRPMAMKWGLDHLAMLSWPAPEIALGLASLILLVTVIALIRLERRFWCRNLCPLGAFLSLLSRFSLRGRKVSDACISCAQCAKACPMNAIGDDFTLTSAFECVECGRCEKVCPAGAVSFGFHAPGEQRHAFNPSRRGVMLSAAGGVLAASAAATSVTRHTIPAKRLRPPGALVENDFLEACLRCGACMNVCPTHGLQPAAGQAGFEGLFTPVLVPRVGGCEETCRRCGEVCPTGAIRNLPLEEKQYAVIGNATIERTLCIAWEQGKICLVCDEICPYDAIEFQMVTDDHGTVQRPFVIEEKCVGCGQCENACPVLGRAAITVTPAGEVRKNSGSYITDRVRELRSAHTRDAADSFAGSAPDSSAGVPASQNSVPAPAAGDELPPGFVQ